MGRGAWRATVCEVAESDTTEQLNTLAKICQKTGQLSPPSVGVGWLWPFSPDRKLSGSEQEGAVIAQPVGEHTSERPECLRPEAKLKTKEESIMPSRVCERRTPRPLRYSACWGVPLFTHLGASGIGGSTQLLRGDVFNSMPSPGCYVSFSSN